MPHGLWLTLALFGLFVLARYSRASFRRSVRKEVRAYLLKRRPDFTVKAETETTLLLDTAASGEVTFNLHNVFFEVSQLRPDTANARQQVYRRMVDALEEGLELQRPTLEKHGTRILPRLVGPSFQHNPAMANVVRQELPGTGLSTVYVVDGNAGVAYITHHHLKDMGLDVAALHARAMENLAAKWDDAPLRELRATNAVTVWKTGDTFDAARLLLLPQHLAQGETILAAVPDRDTLVLLPANMDEKAARRLAATPGHGPPVGDVPLRVTARGFERI